MANNIILAPWKVGKTETEYKIEITPEDILDSGQKTPKMTIFVDGSTKDASTQDPKDEMALMQFTYALGKEVASTTSVGAGGSGEYFASRLLFVIPSGKVAANIINQLVGKTVAKIYIKQYAIIAGKRSETTTHTFEDCNITWTGSCELAMAFQAAFQKYTFTAKHYEGDGMKGQVEGKLDLATSK